MTVNAGANDQVNVSDAKETLQGIQGGLDIVGLSAGDRVTVNDGKDPRCRTMC